MSKEEAQKKQIEEALTEGKSIGISVDDFISKEVKPIKLSLKGSTWEITRYYKSESLSGVTICNSIEEVLAELEPHLPVLSHELQVWKEGKE